jgi:hypothetical protein
MFPKKTNIDVYQRELVLWELILLDDGGNIDMIWKGFFYYTIEMTTNFRANISISSITVTNQKTKIWTILFSDGRQPLPPFNSAKSYHGLILDSKLKSPNMSNPITPM